MSNYRLNTKYSFILYLFIAILLLNIPLISIPFKWFESFFHEISHGLAALLSGGSIEKIQLFPNGAGLCTTRGGSRFLISFMGYAGAALWGIFIYMIASSHHRIAQGLSLFLMALLVITLIFWSTDILTWIILSCLLILMFFQIKLYRFKSLQNIIKVLGLTVLLNAVQSPLYLLDGRSIGDGASLANITYIPEIFWVLLWCFMGLYGLYRLSRYNIKNHRG